MLIDLLVASSRDTIPDVSSNFIDLLYSDLSWHGLKIYCFSASRSICIKLFCSSIIRKKVKTSQQVESVQDKDLREALADLEEKVLTKSKESKSSRKH